MAALPYKTALIVGTGPGLSASLTRLLSREGVAVAVAARETGKLASLLADTGAKAFAADATDAGQVSRLFDDVAAAIGGPEIVVYNASARVPGPLAELDPEAVRQAMAVTAHGAFLVVQQAARRMQAQGHGAILLTGATAGIKGFARSAAFAMGKFALRGLAQSAARELGPKGIHVAHINIDGGIRSAARPVPAERPDSLLDPDAIAQTYLDILRQPRSTWTFEVDLRPWVESF